MLEARNITFSYDGTIPILDSLSFQIRRGEIVVITGSTGSGKSTLAKCLSGFIPRNVQGNFSGSVIIDDSDITEFHIAEVARKVALVQQDPESQICTLQVSDEVAFGPENYGIEVDEISKMVSSSLKSVDSEHLHNRPTFELSGGEKQRLIIASMIACRPNFLILDEPSSSLDPRGIIQLRHILKDLQRQDVGIIIIEHNLSAIQQVTDRVLTLTEGKLQPFKTPEKQDSPKILSKTSEESKSPLISTTNLEFSYGLRKVINNVTLSFQEGEVVGLMGANGSGKTTLLGLLSGILAPDTGTIHFRNSSLRNMSTKEIANQISIVFQNPNHQIFEKTVWNEQVLTVKSLELDTSDMLAKCESALKRTGLNDLHHRNPFSLSHGQKRRLNVSSVIVHNPELLFLDEPFIGQDLEGQEFIEEVIMETAARSGMVVVVTHDPNYVRTYCNRAIFMENGSILLDGSPVSVLDQLGKIGYKDFAETGVQL